MMTRPKVIQPRNESDTESQNSFQSLVLEADYEQSLNESDGEATHHDETSSQDFENAPDDNLKDISFGALAQAQAKLTRPSRKRKLSDLVEPEPLQDHLSKRQIRQSDDSVSERRPPQDLARSSKHAPTAMSTRNPVSRKRAIFSPPPADKSRDPRFDATIVADAARGTTSSQNRAARNYGFLSEYQAAEVLDLKSQLKKAKDPDVQSQLKRQIMSIEAKLRNAEVSKRESEILQDHKRKEKQAIKEGKKAKPYYLKPSEVRKQINQERQDAMGKRARDKAEKRKKKRDKTKESRDMPRSRRLVA